MSKLVYRLSVGILAGWLYFAGPGTAAERGLAARWDFEQGNARETLDRASGIPDLIKGYSAYVPGASGRGLRFDGYTTAVVREAGKAPRLANAFTLEAWVAVQAYPWGPCAIISQCEMREAKLQAKEREFTPEEDPTAGYYFAVDADGYVHLEALIGDRWRRCRSRTQVPLMKWTHIAGTWDAAEGLTVYINGEKAGSEPAAGELTYSPDADLEIGRNPVAKPPQYPIRLNIPASYSFDGSIDEVKIHRTALPSSAIRQAYHSGRPKHGTGMSFRKLPRQPRGPAPFGAYYEKLKFDDSWDAPRRDGPKPDVVVLFDEHPHRYIFWRGTGFIPHWVTENDIWYTNEFNETWGHGALGCAEPMSDKQGRFSRVRILEQNDARVVVHWRYALVDNRYHFARVDPQSGWGDWSDEYHTIYPDAVGIRKITLHSSQPMEAHEFQESIVLNEAGTRPEDNIETRAVTMVNMAGETHTYSWAEAPPAKIDQPAGANIEYIHTKSRARPFLIVSDNDPRFRPYNNEIKRENSIFPWWNHWPVAQIPSDGRWARYPDRTSHSSLTTGLEWENYEVTQTTRTRIMMHGLTEKSPAELVWLAKSWLRAPELKLTSAAFTSQGYEQVERAYSLKRRSPGELSGEIAAGAEHPLVNPAFLIRNWGTAEASLSINGKRVERGASFRYGHRRSLESDDLIVWLKLESTKPLRIQFQPASHQNARR